SRSYALYTDSLEPDLDSFPTRRSSDLGARRCVVTLPGVETTGYSLFRHFGDKARTISHCRLGRHCNSDRQWEMVRALSPKCRKRDRKSTRLNSSHVKISYAVFCLK